MHGCCKSIEYFTEYRYDFQCQGIEWIHGSCPAGLYMKLHCCFKWSRGPCPWYCDGRSLCIEEWINVSTTNKSWKADYWIWLYGCDWNNEPRRRLNVAKIYFDRNILVSTLQMQLLLIIVVRLTRHLMNCLDWWVVIHRLGGSMSRQPLWCSGYLLMYQCFNLIIIKLSGLKKKKPC